MKSNQPTVDSLTRRSLALCLATLVAGSSFMLVACDKTVSKSKTTTSKTTTTPDGDKKTTTETTEKKVEQDPKNPPH
ncbi:MAG: hypothetical protein H7210_01325 [Pyrinomonadaceae bacterium]|nr:hypothetical protein [Phycisphaerales bacterium]